MRYTVPRQRFYQGAAVEVDSSPTTAARVRMHPFLLIAGTSGVQQAIYFGPTAHLFRRGAAESRADKEGAMNQRAYTLTTSVIFLVIGILHLLRIIFGWKAAIGGGAVPMWASWVALVVAGFLGYEGFRLARKSQ